MLQQLQISNPEFFRAYSIRLRIKEHIIAYNYLIKLQVLNIEEVALLSHCSLSC